MRIDRLCQGSIDVKQFEHEVTGQERMFVPAAERYAVVPGSSAPVNEEASAVPEVQATSPKRARRM
jgi:hypothetical protein